MLNIIKRLWYRLIYHKTYRALTELDNNPKMSMVLSRMLILAERYGGGAITRELIDDLIDTCPCPDIEPGAPLVDNCFETVSAQDVLVKHGLEPEPKTEQDQADLQAIMMVISHDYNEELRKG